MTVFVVLMLLIQPAHQADPTAVAKRVQEKYRELQTVSCDFRQIYYSGTTGKITEESGKLYLKTPGKMRWDYLEPGFKQYVSDGKDVYWYVREDRNVTHMSLENADQQQTHIRFLMGEGDLLSDFKVSFLEQADTIENYILRGYGAQASKLSRKLPNYEGSFFLRMIPTREEEYDYLIIVVNAMDDYVERLLVFDALGNCTDYLFLNITHPALADSHFGFEVPRGVEVIEEQ